LPLMKKVGVQFTANVEAACSRTFWTSS
jgi:hypothetical protein